MKKILVTVMTLAILLGGLMVGQNAYAESNNVDGTNGIPTDEVTYVKAEDPFLRKEVTYVKTSVTNESGKTFELMYDADINWPESDEETLARFLNHEGGTLEEKEMIADIVAARVSSKDFPDTVKDVLKQRNLFYINTEFWNGLEAPSEDVLEIARKALKEGGNSKYRQYIYKEVWSRQEVRSIFSVPESEINETENYLFF